MAQESIDLSHDADHVLRVYRWALRLAASEAVDLDLAGAAALVHDLVNVPKESADRPLGSELSAIAGAELLTAAGYGPEEIASIVDAVRTCSWSRGLDPTGPLGAVLQDADRLDAIGAIGLARNFACAQAMAARSGQGRLVHPEDPAGLTGRELDDKAHAADHHRVKLLKLAATMHTALGRTEGARRHAFIEAFLDQLAAEKAPQPTELP